MIRRLYELAMFGLCYVIDPNLLFALWLLECAYWYFDNRDQVKSNGF